MTQTDPAKLVGNAAEHVTSIWMACKGEQLCTDVLGRFGKGWEGREGSKGRVAKIPSPTVFPMFCLTSRQDGVDHWGRGWVEYSNRSGNDSPARLDRMADEQGLDVVFCE